MADLDVPRRRADRPRGVGKEHLLLVRPHEPEELPGLAVIIGILAVVPVIGGPVRAEGRLGKVWLLLPLAVAVGLVAERAAVIAVHPHRPVAVIAVMGATGGIDRDQVVINAKPVELGIVVRKETSLEHLVR